MLNGLTVPHHPTNGGMDLGETVEAEAKRANRPGPVSRISRVTKPLYRYGGCQHGHLAGDFRGNPSALLVFVSFS
jgi:hypothetical protein